MTYRNYPFIIFYFYLSECNTVETKLISYFIQQHNSGSSSSCTISPHLRHSGVIKYICGFDGDESRPAIFHGGKEWETRRNNLITRGIYDPK